MPSFLVSGSFYKKALLSFKMSETDHRSQGQCHITENLQLQLHHCHNLKSYICNSTGALSVTFFNTKFRCLLCVVLEVVSHCTYSARSVTVHTVPGQSLYTWCQASHCTRCQASHRTHSARPVAVHTVPSQLPYTRCPASRRTHGARPVAIHMVPGQFLYTRCPASPCTRGARPVAVHAVPGQSLYMQCPSARLFMYLVYIKVKCT